MFLTTIVIATSDFNIVDKPFNELGEGEISYLEIEDDDTNFIINEIRLFPLEKRKWRWRRRHPSLFRRVRIQA